MKVSSQPNFNSTTKPRHSMRLWPPGFVLYIHKDEDKFHIEKSHPSLFSNVIISNKMISDHFPDKYEDALKLAESSIERDLEIVERLKNKLSPSQKQNSNPNFVGVKDDSTPNLLIIEEN